jgi:hypothetical protein
MKAYKKIPANNKIPEFYLNKTKWRCKATNYALATVQQLALRWCLA